MGCPVLMYIWGGTAIPAPYTVYNTTRVGVHIACICERKGVGTFTTRKRSYTIDCIYLYLIYVDIIRAPKWGPFFHLTPNIKKHKNGNLLFSKTLWRRGKYILIYFTSIPI
jgi:hypothetical protein